MKRRDFIQLSAITGIGLGLSTKLYGNKSTSNKAGKVAYKAYTPSFSFNSDGSFNIRNNDITLNNCFPAIGDKAIKPLSFSLNKHTSGKAQISYALEQGELVLDFETAKNKLYITPALRRFEQAPDYFFTVCTRDIRNSSRFFKQDIGYNNQSAVISLADINEHSVTESYLITGFIAENDETLTVSADKNGEFLFKSIYKGLTDSRFEFKTGFYTENKELEKSTLTLPGIVFMGGDKPFLAFTNQAGHIKRTEGIGVVRNPQNNWHTVNTGITGAAFYAALEEAGNASANNASKVVYIDDDYCNYGDWLTVNNNWTEGLSYTANRISSYGFIPGIRIAPYYISNDSTIYKKHADWLMKLPDGSPYAFRQSGYEELYLLDYSNTEVTEYIRQTFKTLKDWGFRNFKIDLMGMDIEEIVSRTDNQTDLVSFSSARKFLEVIRGEIGEEGYMLYCNGPLQMAVGLANGNGIAMGNFSVSNALKFNTEAYFNQYFNNILWQNHINNVYSEVSGHNFGAFLGTAKDYTLEERIQIKDSLNNDKPVRAYLPSWPANSEHITALKFNGDQKSMSLMLLNNSDQHMNKHISIKSLTNSATHVLIVDNQNDNKRDLGKIESLEVNLESGQSNTFYLEPDVLPTSLYSLG